jgi:hypothetical protein
MTLTCSYGGHTCGRRVQFISRYRTQQDYCIDGVRFTVFDNGEVYRYPGVSPEDLQRLSHYLLSEYANYCHTFPLRVHVQCTEQEVTP